MSKVVTHIEGSPHIIYASNSRQPKILTRVAEPLDQPISGIEKYFDNVEPTIAKQIRDKDYIDRVLFRTYSVERPWFSALCEDAQAFARKYYPNIPFIDLGYAQVVHKYLPGSNQKANHNGNGTRTVKCSLRLFELYASEQQFN